MSRVTLEAVAVAEGEVDIPPIVSKLDPTLKVVGDEDELRGVLLNLLKNAAEAMRERPGGRIEVVARSEESSVVIEVRDEGKGLGGVDREQLFRPFYTTKTGGTGLGLAISRSAIEAAGGRLSLLPREDEPARWRRVVLPVPSEASAVDSGGAAMTGEGSEASGPEVAVVEDERNLRELYLDVLSARGLRVVPLESVAAAEAYLARRAPDLLLLDVKLGDGDGLVLLDRLRARGCARRSSW